MRTLIRITKLLLRVLWWAILAAALCALCCCSTVRYVPVETVKTDSVYINKVERDSIYVRDSILVRLKNDTVFVDRWRTEYREFLKVDTVRSERVDSVNHVVEVERELTRMQNLKLDIGTGVLWAVPILLVIYILYRKLKK